MNEFPALEENHFRPIDQQRMEPVQRSVHAPRIVLLYGSLRERYFSRLVIEESARPLEKMGCETRIFDPRGLPLPDSEDVCHPKVQELRILGRWMPMITIPNQSSVAKAFLEFDENDRMKPSGYYDRIVDVMEERVNQESL